MAFTAGQTLTAAQLNAISGQAAKVTRSTAGPSMSSSSTWYQVTTFDVSQYDDASIINTSTGVVTIPSAGKWRAVLSFPWSSYGTANERRLAWMKGTSAPGTPLASKKITISGPWWDQVEVEDNFTAGDTLTAWVYSATTSSGAEPGASSAPLTAITVERVA